LNIQDIIFVRVDFHHHIHHIKAVIFHPFIFILKFSNTFFLLEYQKVIFFSSISPFLYINSFQSSYHSIVFVLSKNTHNFFIVGKYLVILLNNLRESSIELPININAQEIQTRVEI